MTAELLQFTLLKLVSLFYLKLGLLIIFDLELSIWRLSFIIRQRELTMVTTTFVLFAGAYFVITVFDAVK